MLVQLPGFYGVGETGLKAVFTSLVVDGIPIPDVLIASVKSFLWVYSTDLLFVYRKTAGQKSLCCHLLSKFNAIISRAIIYPNPFLSCYVVSDKP